jgi:MFS family permease
MATRSATDEPAASHATSSESWRLAAMFAVFYFVQGVCEPTAGLIHQPLQALLEGWGSTVRQTTTFFAVLSVPWTVKPVFGLISDFLPLRGSRRRSYIILTMAIAALGFAAVARLPLESQAVYASLLAVMLLPAIAIAFYDVVVDGLMVETGQPRRLTGRLQAVQWAALYGSQIISGFVGGWLSEHGQQRLGIIICCLFALTALCLTILFVREPPHEARRSSFAEALRELGRALRSPVVLGVGGFLFLWNFNPFSSVILQNHMTGAMNLGQQFYGNTQSVMAIASVIASLAYWMYCRRVPLRWLLHLSIVLGILSTLAYWAMTDKTSAMVVSAAVGFTYMTATLITLDLAARSVPIASAGTMFALLMSLSNLGTSLSMNVGGWIHDYLGPRIGPLETFNALVGIGAIFTAGCWLLVPTLRRLLPRA